MSWRDSAVKVERYEDVVADSAEKPVASSWRDSAIKTEPVTKEEAVNPVETAAQAEEILEQEGGTFSDFMTGTATGATFGFADEISGMMGALGDKALETLGVFGEVTPEERSKSVLDRYREYRDEARQREKESFERSPIATTAGTVSGSLLIPGAGASNFIRGAGTVGGRIARAAGVSGAMGAVAGAGTSEAETVEGVGKDVLVGGALGSAAGGAIPATGVLGSAAIGKLKQAPMAEAAIESAKRAYQGTEVFGRKAFKALEDKVVTATKDVVETMKGGLNNLAKYQRHILDTSDAVVDVTPTMRGLRDASRTLREAPQRRGISSGLEISDAKELSNIANRYTNKSAFKGKVSSLRALKNTTEQMEKNLVKVHEGIKKDAAKFQMQSKALDNQIINAEQAHAKALERAAKATTDQSRVTSQDALDRASRRLDFLKQKKDFNGNQYRQSMQKRVEDYNASRMSVQQSKEALNTAQNEFREALELYRMQRRELQQIPLKQAYEQQRLLKSVEGLSKTGEAAALKSPEGSNLVQNLRRELAERNYAADPRLRAVNERLTKFNNVLESVGIEKISQESLTPANLPDFQAKFMDIIGKLDDQNMTGIQMRNRLNLLAEGMEDLLPEVSDKYVPLLRDLAKQYELIGPTTSRESIGGIRGPISQVMTALGEAGGKAARVVRDFAAEAGAPVREIVQDAASIGRSAVSGIDQAARWTANQIFDDIPGFLQSPAAQSLQSAGQSGQSLLRALNTMASDAGHNSRAMQHMIMQNPKYRELLGMTKEDLSGEEEE